MAGGPVEAGQAYVVGEREPELFVPRISGTILNQSQQAELRSLLNANAAPVTNPQGPPPPINQYVTVNEGRRPSGDSLCCVGARRPGGPPVNADDALSFCSTSRNPRF